MSSTVAYERVAPLYNIKHLPEYDTFHGCDPEKIIARLRRSLDRLPDQMYCVRKTLTLQLQQAKAMKKNTTMKDVDTC